MTQAPNWGVPTTGPGTMSAYAARDVDSLTAVLTEHSGASRPSYAQAQTFWIKIISSTAWEWYLYTGTVDILVGTFNPTTGSFTANSAVLGFDVSQVMKNNVSPLAFINNRAAFAQGSNGEAILTLLGRTSGNGDEAAIRWSDGVSGSTRFQLLSEQTLGLRLLDGAAVEFLEFMATGDIESKLWGKLSEQITPTGSIVHGPWNTAPPGFVTASGALVSRTTYASLWAAAQARGRLVTEVAWSGGQSGAFSTGDGSTTFRLPRLNGDFVRSVYQDGGGYTIGTWQDSTNKAHAHTIFDPGHSHQFNATLASIDHNRALTGSDRHSALDASQGTDSRVTNIVIQSQGGSEACPKNIPLLACIKV